MEVILVLVFLYWFCWATFHSVRHTASALQEFIRLRRLTRTQARAEKEQSRQRQMQLATDRQAAQRLAAIRSREMQLAILNLSSRTDPDFRRAAVVVQDAQVVPTDFRRRQFHRLRPLLVRHYESCSRKGCDPELLHSSLMDLVAALGMEEFEADYIRQEYERNRELRTGGNEESGSAHFQARLTQVQRAHDQRMEVIRALTNLTDDVRAQLIEAEERRFQEQLFGRSNT